MNTSSFSEPNTSGIETKRPAWGAKRIFKYIVLGFAAVLAALAIVIAMQPADFHVTRSATMAAPAAAVFDQVNNFHNWDAWSPWAKLDPQAKNTFDGPSSGTGAVFHWSGDSNVGEGSMTIVESRPNDLVRLRLDFVRPFAGTSDVQFSFKPDGDQTVVTWGMAGKNNFMAKAIGLFMDCEKMIGEQFDQGLANIKSLVEADSDEPQATT